MTTLSSRPWRQLWLDIKSEEKDGGGENRANEDVDSEDEADAFEEPSSAEAE